MRVRRVELQCNKSLGQRQSTPPFVPPRSGGREEKPYSIARSTLAASNTVYAPAHRHSVKGHLHLHASPNDSSRHGACQNSLVVVLGFACKGIPSRRLPRAQQAGRYGFLHETPLRSPLLQRGEKRYGLTLQGLKGIFPWHGMESFAEARLWFGLCWLFCSPSPLTRQPR